MPLTRRLALQLWVQRFQIRHFRNFQIVAKLLSHWTGTWRQTLLPTLGMELLLPCPHSAFWSPALCKHLVWGCSEPAFISCEGCGAPVCQSCVVGTACFGCSSGLTGESTAYDPADDRPIQNQEWKPMKVCCTESGELLITMRKLSTPSRVVRYSGSTEKQVIQFDDKQG